MRKLNLKLDTLVVESFIPSPTDAGYRGTVAGNQLTPATAGPTCENCNTVDVTYCGNTTCYTGGTTPPVNTWVTCPPAKTCFPPTE
jgi:hypothetical protein